MEHGVEELLAKLPTAQAVLALTPNELDGIVLSCAIERCDNRLGVIPGRRYFSIDEINNLYPIGPELRHAMREQAIDQLYDSFSRLKADGYIAPARDQYGLMSVTEKGRKGLAADQNRPALMSWAGGDRALLAVVFTDIVGSTAMGRRLGDERMNLVRSAHFERALALIRQYAGYEVKNTGDGVMAAVRSVGAALDFALALNADPGHEELAADGIRAGIHTGQTVVAESDLFGGEVDYAARVEQALSGPGICLSERAKHDLDGAASERHGNLQWEPFKADLKGIGSQQLWSLKSATLRQFTQPVQTSDIRLVLGVGAPFDRYKSRLHFKEHRILIGVENVSLVRQLTNCDVSVEQISGRLSHRCPVKIKSEFVLNPGAKEYIPFVEWDEVLRGPSLHESSAGGNPGIEAYFPINPLSNGVSYLDDEPYDLVLRATAAESPPHEVRCRLWIENGVLRLEPAT
jgi:class 3 adenylate cyclase